MSDTRALILTIVGTGLAVITVLSMQIAGVNTRIDDVRADVAGQIANTNTRIDDLRNDVDNLRTERRDDNRDLRTRLRAVEVAFSKVEQRLETLERVLLPPPEPAAE